MSHRSGVEALLSISSRCDEERKQDQADCDPCHSLSEVRCSPGSGPDVCVRRTHVRGELRPGAWADVAVFDPTTFAERGTTFEPNQTAVGMKYVLVNGILTLADGAMTGRRGGAVLRRGVAHSAGA